MAGFGGDCHWAAKPDRLQSALKRLSNFQSRLCSDCRRSRPGAGFTVPGTKPSSAQQASRWHRGQVSSGLQSSRVGGSSLPCELAVERQLLEEPNSPYLPEVASRLCAARGSPSSRQRLGSVELRSTLRNTLAAFRGHPGKNGGSTKTRAMRRHRAYFHGMF
jgi:hypothetical protein